MLTGFASARYEQIRIAALNGTGRLVASISTAGRSRDAKGRAYVTSTIARRRCPDGCNGDSPIVFRAARRTLSRLDEARSGTRRCDDWEVRLESEEVLVAGHGGGPGTLCCGATGMPQESLRRDLQLDVFDELWSEATLSESKAPELTLEAQHVTRPRRRASGARRR